MTEQKRPVLIGLTGLTGAGKSTVAALFAQRGYCVIDADAISRSVTEKGSPVLARLATHFGDDIILPDGSLDRHALASRAFVCEESTGELNSIVHPAVIRLISEQVKNLFEQGKSAVLDAPLLFECSLEAMCDFTVTVVCPREIRLERLQKRDGLPTGEIEKRMNVQSEEDIQTQKSDYIIINDGKTDLSEQIEAILNKEKH